MLDKLQDEYGRVAALDRYDILDTEPEAQFDRVTALVRTVLNVPMAAVTLISSNRQWFKSRQGIAVSETSRHVSFCTHTIQAREPMVVPDAKVHPLFSDHPGVTGDPFVRSYLGVPLASPDGFNLGALCAVDTRPRQFDQGQVQIMTNFAALVMDEMELRLIAQTDFLTGAMTRRAFKAELDRAWARFARQSEPSAVLLLDIDHFKAVNDSLGHAAGDVVLAAVVNCCGIQMRTGDALGRIGGEEFAILLGNVSLEEAAMTAERFRGSIAGLELDAYPQLKVTASIGIAPLTSDVASMEDWLARADLAMYSAKRSGRNRCSLATATLDQRGQL